MSKTAKRLWLGAILAVAATCVLLFVTARSFAGKFEPEVRRRVVQYLEQRFDSDVSLAELKIRLPKVSLLGLLFSGGHGTTAHVSGKKLTLRYRNSVAGDPPLFAVDSFSFDLDLGMLAQPHPRIPHLLLEGMSIAISHRGDKPDGPKTVGHSSNSNLASNVIIDKIDISHARLLILPKKADAKPLDFGLDSIQLTSAGIGSQLHYQAVLMNPRPPGKIRATGAFGPWNSDAPGDTPLDGDYDFSNANLGVFPAIAGILHSTGHFVGTLSAVRARGEATVPDFRLTASGNRVPLETQYDVLVDGTNGNTVLQPVHARLGNTEFVTSGGIIKHEEGGRRAINLDVSMAHGHIEDLLLLSVKGKPFMSGSIQMNAKISIPPLGGSVKDKLHLEGTFDIAKGEFLRDAVQDKVDELSRRGQGKPGDPKVDNVFSRMTGTFQMEDQVLTFKRLSFEVPGATVGLHGDYRMARDTLDFHGSLRLKAKISETLSGWKHWLAKPIDPFFAKNGAGTFLKIQVVGSASKPEFGRDHGEGQ
jgi:hypothetical protein